MTAPGPWTIFDQENRDVEVHGLDTVVVSIPRDEYTLDDARLIAAAPQLLAACLAVINDAEDFVHARNEWTDDYRSCSDELCSLCLCKRAVAKAEGV